MYKRVKKSKLGVKASHRDSLRKNLLRSLVQKGSVVTTTPKAKVLKMDASSLIEKGKKNNELEIRRSIQDTLGSDTLAKKLIEYSAKEKTGVKIVKVGFRDGDSAEISRITLIGTEKKKASKKDKEEKAEEKVQEEKKVVQKKEANKRGIFIQDKKVDTTTVVKNTERARTRAGL